MGVRIAIGASYQSVRRMMLQENLLPVCFGIAAEIVLSIAGGRYLQHLLENADRPTFGACVTAACFLLFSAVAAV